jgi:methylamine dehydrogenase heavy chain
MTIAVLRYGAVAFLGSAVFCSPLRAAEYPEPLALEPIPAINTLPEKYPPSWVFVHDFNFNSIIDGRVAVIDVSSPNRNLKGQIPVAHFGNFLASKTRPEVYASQSFYSKLTRGERSDYLTVYDTPNLAPIADIELPSKKRGLAVSYPPVFQLIDSEKMALVWNFTPASSFYVVDLINRKVINEIETPGCSMAHSTGQRGFTTLCNDGGGVSFQLDADGKVLKQTVVKPFNDIDGDSLFMFMARVGDTSYFPTYTGNVLPVDFSKDVAKPGRKWSLVTTEERSAGWRPGGWQIIASDATGRLYVLMHAGGKEGSHKDPGTEVWVFDANTKRRVQRIALETPATTIEVTSAADPHLVTTPITGGLDVYSVSTGKRLQNLAGNIVSSPLVITASRH